MVEGAMDVDYELAQELKGHDGQVRCVAFLNNGALVTGGLDAQVIVWQRPSADAGFELSKQLGHHSDFIYAVAPSSQGSGCFYTASKDKTAVRVDGEGNPVMQYSGHAGPVCSVVECGAQVITGAWDGKAKVWDSATGELRHTLDAGGEHAVTVAVLPTGEVVTGSQDRSLRVFKGAECQHTVKDAHGDIIRGISTSSTNLVTAANDSLLKMWSLDGCEMAQFAGHQSYVYSVCHFHDNQAVLSTSDDCTLKIWSIADSSCKQSIVHCGTVWQGTALPNSDVATVCQDKVVRIWTRDPARMAPEAVRQAQKEEAEKAALEAAAKGSSSTSVTSADISTMPTTKGQKNGEIKCFKDGGVVYAFSWNVGAQQWDKIGEVVSGAEQKKMYAGDPVFAAGEYDFIFDVDMGPAHGMRQLPYNRGQNPMLIAESFCAREQIDKGNTDQIRQFIMKNAGEDPAATPAAPAAPAQPAAPAMFPVMAPLSFKDGKFDALQGKILEFNGLVDESLRMSAAEVASLQDVIAKLKRSMTGAVFKGSETEVVFVKLRAWPRERLFPVIDLWRLLLANPESSAQFKGSDRGTTFIMQVLGFLAEDASGALGLCSARYLANLFIYQTNRYAIWDKRVTMLQKLEPVLDSTTNKHTKVACATMLLNMAVVLHEITPPPKAWDKEIGSNIAHLALAFVNKAGPDDGDAVQRAVLALGTLLPRDKENGAAIAAECTSRLLPRLGALEATVGAKAVADLRILLA